MKSARSMILRAALAALIPILAGCGMAPAERIQKETQKGDDAMSAGHPDEAIDAYNRAMQVVARRGGAFDDSKLRAARTAAGEEARTALRRARDLFGSSPTIGRDFTNRAIRLASPEYGNDPGTASSAADFKRNTVDPFFAEKARQDAAHWAQVRRDLKMQFVNDRLKSVQDAASDWRRETIEKGRIADPASLKSRIADLKRELQDEQNEMDPEVRSSMRLALISLEGAADRASMWQRSGNQPPSQMRWEILGDVNKGSMDVLLSTFPRSAKAPQPAPPPAGTAPVTRAPDAAPIPAGVPVHPGTTPAGGRGSDDDMMAGLERTR